MTRLNVALLGCALVALPVAAQDPAPATGGAGPLPAATDGDASPHQSAAWNERLRRLAEAMEWTDELVRHDWRVQRRAGSDGARVLDPADRVVCEGSAEECRRTFTALGTEGRIPAVEGHAVILLHGLGEGRGSMRPLADALRDRLDATVMTFGYASPRAGIGDHAAALADVVGGLPDADRISFVGHSLGNLVVRRWMADAGPADRERLHRMVMLGAPNQGSQMAREAARVWVLQRLSTGAARELVLDWPRIAASLAVPPCPFGIVAGGAGDGRGYSTLLEGDDDAVVRVEETRLEGADDFVVLPVRHAFMMQDPDVQRATGAFLETGRFQLPGAASEAAP